MIGKQLSTSSQLDSRRQEGEVKKVLRTLLYSSDFQSSKLSKISSFDMFLLLFHSKKPRCFLFLPHVRVLFYSRNPPSSCAKDLQLILLVSPFLEGYMTPEKSYIFLLFQPHNSPFSSLFLLPKKPMTSFLFSWIGYLKLDFLAQACFKRRISRLCLLGFNNGKKMEALTTASFHLNWNLKRDSKPDTPIICLSRQDSL